MVGYGIRQIRMVYLVGFTALLLAGSGVKGFAAQSSGEEHGLLVPGTPADGRYDIAMPKSRSYALRAGMGLELDGRWLHASDYPRHVVEHSQVQGYLGEATDWQVSYSGLSGQPDLVYHLRAYSREPFGDIQVTVRNTTGKEIHLESIRCLDATEGPIIDLGGPVLEDRVLSHSFSEDHPAITIRNFADAEQQMQHAVGSQLIYNRQSHESLFLGALTSDPLFHHSAASPRQLWRQRTSAACKGSLSFVLHPRQGRAGRFYRCAPWFLGTQEVCNRLECPSKNRK
jgi:alpha-galactosidase